MKSLKYFQNRVNLTFNLKSKFKHFSTTTTIHGFFDILNADNLAWKFIWTIILSASIAVTVYQVRNAIQQYNYQSTITNVVDIDPDNFLFPPLKICYSHWMYWVDWEKALKNFTKPSLLYGLSYMNSVYSDEYFNVSQSESEFERLMTLYNYSTLEQFYENIARPFPYAEQQDVFVGLDRKELNEKFNWGNVLCYVTSGRQIVYILDEFQSSRHAGYPNRKNKIDIMIRDQLYYKHLSNYITLNEYNFYINDRLSQTSKYRLNTADPLKFEKRNLSEITLPLLIYPDGYSNDAVIIRYEHEFYQVKLNVNVNRWKPSNSWPCRENAKFIKSAEIVYINRCQSKYRPRRNCKCLDLYSAILSGENNYSMNKRKFCRNKIYFFGKDEDGDDDNLNSLIREGKFFFNTTRKTCAKNETLMKEREICISQLSYPCEIWAYRYTYSFDSLMMKNDDFSKNVTTVEINYPGYYDIFMLIETDSQTWEDFVGNVGGLLGVWTGASLLSIVQLFYLCCFINDSKNEESK